jgi:AraC-like DNA-binding protein
MLFHDPAQVNVVRGDFPLQAAETLIIWPPGTGQYYGNAGAPFSHSWLHCLGARVDRILAALPAPLPLAEPFPLREREANAFQNCLMEIHSELIAQSRPDEVLAGNLMENCLRQIARARQDAVEPRPSNPAPRLLAVRAYIGSHSAEPLTLPLLAQLAGMSVPYFCARFKAAFAQSPIDYLIQHRMLHAAHLLTDQAASVSEIAQRVGYEDAFHFSKMFKRHFGKSPRDFRQAASAPSTAAPR